MTTTNGFEDYRPSVVRDWNAEAEREAFLAASAEARDSWVTAAGGHEVPLLRNGAWSLYVWNPYTREHGWLDIASDTVSVDC